MIFISALREPIGFSRHPEKHPASRHPVRLNNRGPSARAGRMPALPGGRRALIESWRSWPHKGSSLDASSISRQSSVRHETSIPAPASSGTSRAAAIGTDAMTRSVPPTVHTY